VNEAPTYQGIMASVVARRDEAIVAMSFLRQVEQLATDTRSLRPEGQTMAKAVDDARTQAVEAVMLWRTACSEALRAAQDSHARRVAGGGR
jgi:hypothetical protein